MKRLLTILAIVAVLFSSSAAYGKYGLKPYSFTVVDEFRNTVTDSVTMVVYTAGSSAATVYSDANKTAIGTTLTAVTDGVFTFWYGPATCDIKVTNNSTGNAVKVTTLTPTDHSLMLSRNEAVLSATNYTGTVTGVASDWTGNMTLGVDGTGVDVTFYSDTASDYALWDQNAQTNGVLIFEDTGSCYNDDTRIRFGDGASAGAGDLYLASDSSNVLTLGQVVSTAGTFVIGVDGVGIDTTFYAETASDKMWWDQDGNTNVGALTFANSAILFDQATVDYTLVAASNALSLTATDNASAALTLGSTGTNGLDVVFQSDTAGDHVTFNAGDKRFEFEDCSLLVLDDTTLIFGDGSDVTLKWDHSGDGDFQISGATSFVSAVSLEGAVTLGDGAADVITFSGTVAGASPIVLEGATANEHETTLAVEDPTADNTLTLPNDTGTLTYTPGGKTTKDATDAALPLTHSIIEGTSGAASAWSLANGTLGQILTIVIVTDGGDAVITPATKTGWATIALTDDIDSVTVLYVDGTVGWIILGTSGAGAGPIVAQ